MAKTNKVDCPACGKTTLWTTENKDRPFCSPRCKLIDLGQWASEEHCIPGAPAVLEDLVANDEDEVVNKQNNSDTTH